MLPAVFAVHVLEEAPGFTDWVNRYAWDGYTNDDFIRLNGFGLAATVAATLVASRFPKRTIVFLYFALILTQQALFNTLFHAGTTVAFRAYSPGLVSALVLFLPVWYWLTRLAFGEGLLTRKRALLAGVIGGLIHTGAVAQQVFGLDLR